MRTLINLVLVTMLCTPGFVWGEAKSQTDALCLAKKCPRATMRCGFDKECRNWVQCVLKCGDDKIKCPSFCGFFYQSAQINQTSSCIFESGCVDLGFSVLPNYDHQNRPAETLGGIEGTYWFAASFGGAHIFDYGCQRFDFKKKTSDTLAVQYSVPLTLGDKTRITRTQGIFRELSSGATEVIYDNFSGYHEKWWLVGKTENTLLARVCIGTETICYDYGTILLSKVNLSSLDQRTRMRLGQLTHELFGFSFESFQLSNTEGCPNE